MKKLALSLAVAAAAAGVMAMTNATDSGKSTLTPAGKEFEALSHGQRVLSPKISGKYQWLKSQNVQGEEAEAVATDPIAIIDAAYEAAEGTIPMVPEYPAFTGTVPDSLVVTTVADKKQDTPAVQYNAYLYWMSNDGFSGTEKRYYYGNMMKLEYGTALGDNVFTYSYQNGQKGPVYYRRSQPYNPSTNKFAGSPSRYVTSVDATTIKPDTIFDYSRIAYCEAYDPSTGVVYGCYMSKDGKDIEFGVLEIYDITQERLTLAPMEKPWMACAIDMDGTMYAIEQGGSLCTVDKATGATTKVADTGFASTDRTSGVMDIKNGIFYYFYSDESNDVANLYAIDVRNNNKISLVYKFPYWARIGAMINITNHYIYDAPAAPANGTFTFADGGLKGKAKFTMPAKTLKGDNLSGAIKYEVTAAGKVLASGTAQPGAEVEADITVPETGNYIFRVSASNDKGRSPFFRTADVSWVGNDVPVAPANLKAVYDKAAQKMTLTWDSVKTASHNGYIDTKNVKYNITRVVYGSDTTSTLVASDFASVEFTEDFAYPDELLLIEYIVEPSYLGGTGASAKAEMCPIGRIVAPFLDDFSCVPAFKHYTVIDGGIKGATNFQNIWANSSEPAYFSSPKPSAEKAAIFCSNTSTPKDDWLITAPIYFKKGLTYRVKAEIAQQITSSGEIIGIMLGTAPTVEAMNTTLMPYTTLTCSATSPLFWSYDVEVPEDGEYYIGFHATSPKSKRYITVDDFEIEKPFVTLGPNVPTEVVIDGYQYDGSPKVTIGFNAPKLNNKNQMLTSLTKIEIKRDGEVVKTIPNPTFGDSISYVDVCPELGEYTYRITAFNEHGEGKYVEEKVFTGVFFGARTDSVRIYEDPNVPGQVTVEWDTVHTDVLGREIDPSLVRYTILADIGDPRGMILVGQEGISGTKVTFNALLDGLQQANVYCRVLSVTDIGYLGNGYGGFSPEGYNTSKTISIGYPYDMPIIEDGTVTTNWSYTTDGGQWYGNWKPDWTITNKQFSEVYGVPALDNDNDNAFAWPYYVRDGYEYTIFTGAKTSFFTGKIKITDSELSAMQFYFYDDPAWEDVYEFYPIVHTNDGDIALTQPIYTGQSSEAGWKKVTASLQSLRGQVAQLGIHVNYLGSDKSNRQNFFIIDGIHIREFANDDLWAVSLQAPRLVVGEDNELLGTVRNLGYNASGKAFVELYRNDMLVATKQLPSIEPNGIATVSFIQNPDLFWNGTQKFQMSVIYVDDQVLGNNIANSVYSSLKESDLARVTDLKASAEGLNVTLDWSAPAVPTEATVDGAEDYPTYSYVQIGDFTLVDVDGLPVSPFIPGNIALDVPLSWIVWEDAENSNYHFAHTGKKCFAAFTNGIYGPNEDWLILPRLNGTAQTIKFWANSQIDLFGTEQFEVFYSTTNLELSSFEKIGETQNASANGAEFSFDVPEGTQYFAIRYFGDGNNLAIFVDDIEFKPFGTDATLTGYDVYRDHEKLNKALLSDTSFDDAVSEEGTYAYHVVANYNEGSSRISNEASIKVEETGIADAEAAVKVGAEGRCIVVAGAEGMSIVVAAADGKVIASEIGSAVNRINAAPGVYLVTVGAKTYKVAL